MKTIKKNFQENVCMSSYILIIYIIECKMNYNENYLKNNKSKCIEIEY